MVSDLGSCSVSLTSGIILLSRMLYTSHTLTHALYVLESIALARSDDHIQAELKPCNRTILSILWTGTPCECLIFKGHIARIHNSLRYSQVSAKDSE